MNNVVRNYTSSAVRPGRVDETPIGASKPRTRRSPAGAHATAGVAATRPRSALSVPGAASAVSRLARLTVRPYQSPARCRAGPAAAPARMRGSPLPSTVVRRAEPLQRAHTPRKGE